MRLDRHATALVGFAGLLSLSAAGCCCLNQISYRHGEAGCLPTPAAVMPSEAIVESAPALEPLGESHVTAPCEAEDRDCCDDKFVSWPRFGGLGWLRRHREPAPLDGPRDSSNEPVPSAQRADYVSPWPKFHPLPARPVFEPLPAYGPPTPLELPPALMPQPH